MTDQDNSTRLLFEMVADELERKMKRHSQRVSHCDGFEFEPTARVAAYLSSGRVVASFSNGQTQLLGQIAMASFVNAGGLLRQGQNLYAASSASGTASIGIPGTGGRGTVNTGSLEMSNVDLATQFTSMITAQRGFQANGKVITTSDEMLQDLVNLKR